MKNLTLLGCVSVLGSLASSSIHHTTIYIQDLKILSFLIYLIRVIKIDYLSFALVKLKKL